MVYPLEALDQGGLGHKEEESRIGRRRRAGKEGA